jgi:hypothetical protein
MEWNGMNFESKKRRIMQEMRVYTVRIWMNGVMGVDLTEEIKKWGRFGIIILGMREWDDG